MTSNNIKIALIGDSGVGKTSIALRYTSNEFNENYNSTGGASYSVKIIKINGKTVQLDIWDTAGQEKFRSLAKNFYKDAYIVILVYDITNQLSFNNLKHIWYEELKNNGEENPIIGIAGNKSDQYENENINEEDARNYAKSIDGIFELVSAKTGSNIEILFKRLLDKYYKLNYPDKINNIIKRRQSQRLHDKKTNDSIQNKNKSEKSKCC